MTKINNGFSFEAIQEYKAKIKLAGRNFIFHDQPEDTQEYANFFFIGEHDGKEVVFDAVLYTLRLKYDSELHDMAEQRLLKHFPNYKGITEGESDSQVEEEMGLMMAEFILEIEEEEQLKVQEEITIDYDFDFGIGLEASLNIEQITPDVIERFVSDYNSKSVMLDPILYSFEQNEED
jgi:hypothetical protein